MNISDDDWLALRSVGKLQTCSTKQTFEAIRTDADGVEQLIEIELVDLGPQNPASRYAASARDRHGRVGASNAESSIRSALIGIHWDELDKPKQHVGRRRTA
jgi:hypothetical protein